MFYRKGFTMKYITVKELRINDKVIPLSSNPKEQAKVFTVTDLHPVYLRKTRGERDEYVTVAATLWDGFREHTSRISTFILIERR